MWHLETWFSRHGGVGVMDLMIFDVFSNLNDSTILPMCLESTNPGAGSTKLVAAPCHRRRPARAGAAALGAN